VAQPLNLLCIGSDDDAVLVEKVMKKFFSPRNFNLLVRVPDRQFYEQVVRSIANMQADGRYPRKLLGNFAELELVALSELERDPSAALAIKVEYAPKSVGMGMASQLCFQALLCDSRRDIAIHHPWDYRQAIPFISELTMPYAGSQGVTPEQIERGKQTVLRAVIEGWYVWSKRHGGCA
jgi:hypothetical protein